MSLTSLPNMDYELDLLINEIYLKILDKLDCDNLVISVEQEAFDTLINDMLDLILEYLDCQ